MFVNGSLINQECWCCIITINYFDVGCIIILLDAGDPYQYIDTVVIGYIFNYSQSKMGNFKLYQLEK